MSWSSYYGRLPEELEGLPRRAKKLKNFLRDLREAISRTDKSEVHRLCPLIMREVGYIQRRIITVDGAGEKLKKDMRDLTDWLLYAEETGIKHMKADNWDGIVTFLSIADRFLNGYLIGSIEKWFRTDKDLGFIFEERSGAIPILERGEEAREKFERKKKKTSR